MHRRLSERRRQWRGRHRQLDQRYEQLVLLEQQHHDDLHNRSRRSRMFLRVNDENELCVVCKSYTASYAVCRSCYEVHSQSYRVWKAWIEREQANYQKQLGCTHWNLHWDSVYIQRSCVVNPELLLLKRVKACIGWAVHGVVFEFLDGTRAGYVVDVTSITDDEAIERRRCTDWVDINMGDYVKTVRGYNLSRGCFLCHTIELDLASGRTISFASQHEPWKGEPFQFNLPENALLHHVSFREGKCVGVTAAETVMHLPIKSPQRVRRLGEAYQDNFRLLQLTAQRIDRDRVDEGERPLGRDLWQTILCEFLACHDLQVYESSAIGKVQLRQHLSS
jgi:hypothetical protein